jgi:nucleotide-binding universal stress UspA family protein
MRQPLDNPLYRRILLPTDGSEASQRAILAGVAFAREVGADVVGFTATPAFHVLSTDPDMIGDTAEQYADASRERGGACWPRSTAPHARPAFPAGWNKRCRTSRGMPSSAPRAAWTAT